MERTVDADFLKSLAWSLRRAGFANLAAAAEKGELVDGPASELSRPKSLPPNYAAQPPRNYAARLMARGDQ